MISRIPKNSIRVLIPLLSMLLPFAVQAQLLVNGASGTAATCPNNGSITVSATTSNPPLLYSLVAGPVTQPVQTGAVFNSLPPGNYTVRISDGAGNQTTATANVGGNYQNPTFTVTNTEPYCVGNSDGQLRGNINPGSGSAPFQWQLLAPSPVTTAPQSSNVFTGLPAGNYAVRVTDACGSFSSNAVILQQPDTRFGFWGSNIGDQGSMSFIKVGCDSMEVSYWLSFPNSRMPLRFKYRVGNGVYIPSSGTVLDTTSLRINGQVSVTQIIPGADYGQTIQATIYNACGDSAQTISMTTHPFVFYPRYAFNNCGNTAQVTFANTPTSDFHTSIRAPFTYTFSDAGGTVLQSATVSYDRNNGIINIPGTVNTGSTYRFSVTDGCGETFTSSVVVPGLAPPVIIHEDIISSACIDSVLGTRRVLTSGFQGNARLIMLSGPAVLGSSKPRFAYSDTYTYPDTVRMVNGESFLINNLAVGTYRYKIIDDCGNELPGSFTVTPDQVTSLKATHTVVKGCPGRNKILFGMVSGGKVTIRDIGRDTVLKEKEFIAYTQNSQAEYYNRDSLINLFDGSYEITYEFLQLTGALENGKQLNDSDIPCWILRDTVHIAPYHAPEMFTGNAILCNNSINFVLLPDTTKGLAPYEYEIIAGPQTFPVQNSNIFTIIRPGTYTARIYDACGNASIKQITVDTISFDPIQAVTTCNNAVFAFPPSIYFTYEWLKPNGQIHRGDSLVLIPVTAADTGMYEISKIININGCSDTLHTRYHVGLGIQVRDTVHFCPGSTVTIGTHTYSLPGIYTDTLSSVAGCDSIVTNHLIHIPQNIDTVQVNICWGDSLEIAGVFRHQPGFYADSVQNTLGCYDLRMTNLKVLFSTDTVRVSICNGDSYTFGGHSYQVPGLYGDTLVSALGCDSVRVLSLSLHNYIEQAVRQDICAGRYYLFGSDTLRQTGVYADTLSTAHCDSIVTLTLTVLPYKRYAYGDTLCPGQRIVFGGLTLSQSGTYIDTVSTATCDSIVTLTLTALPYKTATLTRSICAGETYPFGGVALHQTGVYTDTLATVTCDSIVTLNLTVLPYKYHAYALSICEGESIAPGGVPYTQSGTYTDTLSTAACDSIVTVTLTVIPLKYGSVQATICGYEKYLFNGVYYSQAGVYTHHFPTDACDSIVTLYLNAVPGPTVSIGANAHETEDGATVYLQANSGTHPLSYLWSSEAVLNNNSIANPTATITGPTRVQLTVTDSNGCTASAEFQMTIPVTSTLYIPNTYTPNGDRSNPSFKVYGTHIGEFRIMIFNRWGELIFQSSDMDFGWNGTYMGESVQNGMYVYKIQARGLDNARYDRIGHITVLR